MKCEMILPKSADIEYPNTKEYYLTVCPYCRALLSFNSSEVTFGSYDYLCRERRFLGIFKYTEKLYYTHCSECNGRIFKKDCHKFKTRLVLNEAIEKFKQKYDK